MNPNTNSLFIYHVGPFLLESAIEFPELQPSRELPKEELSVVTVELGEVPNELPDPEIHLPFYQATPDDLLFDVPVAARYYLQAGSRVTIQPYPGIARQNWRSLFLGPILCALCQHRGYLTLHASALVLDGEAIVFAGPSRAGKSTLAGWLRAAGYPVLTDDLCILDVRPSEPPIVHPAYPAMRLWVDAVEHLGKKTDGLAQVCESVEKYLIPVGDSFHDESVPLRGVYQLWNAQDLGATRIELLRGAEALNTLIELTHRHYVLRGAERKSDSFRQCANVAQQAKIWRLIRPWGVEHKNSIITFLEHHWAEYRRSTA